MLSSWWICVCLCAVANSQPILNTDSIVFVVSSHPFNIYCHPIHISEASFLCLAIWFISRAVSLQIAGRKHLTLSPILL